MELPGQQRFNVVEVRFKGGRKEFFRNVSNTHLTTGDAVVVEAQSGYHIGYVSLQGELVRLQMLKKKVKDNDEIKSIYRLASQKDLAKLEEVQNRELPTLYRTREIIGEAKLKMKLSDVEFQADNSKATFFYSAEDRVDFRELIKNLAGEFKVRVEMRQISLRQEAGRLGGIGVCGRELCCSTWLTDFKNVSTAAARYQNLSLNPSKLSGQCGRLKCCLNYELETYLDALVDIPKVDKPLETVKGKAYLQKTDIFKKIMWFSYDTESTWYPLSAERVREIQLMNEQGQPVEFLQPNGDAPKANTPPDPSRAQASWVVDEMDESRFDRKGRNNKRNKKKRGPDGRNPQNRGGQGNPGDQTVPKNEGSDNAPPKPENRGPRPPRDRDRGRNRNQGPRPPKNEGGNPQQGPRPPKNEGGNPQQGPRPPKNDGGGGNNRGPRPPRRGPRPPRGPQPPKNEPPAA
ncbi:MAG: Signal peptidase-like protein [Bernardetiaceae bacterium]|jgi:cell fate regulator YaaT (PSP1 superfamily)|nr:Signal peptidase-like protein [Bernardetiaceae bacterium]